MKLKITHIAIGFIALVVILVTSSCKSSSKCNTCPKWSLMSKKSNNI